MDRPILSASVDELRRTRTSVKWMAYGPDVLPLWIAEMDCAPCPPVVEAVAEAVGRGDTGYAWTLPYAEAFADYADAAWGWRPEPRTTVRVTDVLTGISHLLRLLTDDGGPVVVSAPVYNAFYSVIESVGRRAVEAPLTPAGRVDLDALADTFAGLSSRGERAVYLLSNPHNPTGTVPTLEELTTLASLAGEHGVRVVSDEIHAPLVHAPHRFVPYLAVPGAENAFTVTSASKAWNLAGLKAAVVVPGADAVRDLRGLHPFVTFGASHLGVVAQTAAYTHGRGWVAQLLGELTANRDLLARLVDEHLPGARLLLPEATYLAWLDCRGLGLGDDPAAHFRDRAGVALSEGPSFGLGGAGHVRVNVATSPAVLCEAVERMARSLA